jgi:hypothetical protein
VVVKSGKPRVRNTGFPISFNEPPAFDNGAAEKNPANSLNIIRSGRLGARAQPISKSVARRIVPVYTGSLPYTTSQRLVLVNGLTFR